MERKDFIKQCGKLCLGGFIAAEWLSACNPVYYATPIAENNQFVLKKSEFREQGDKIRYRKYVLIRSERLPFPVCVYRIDDEHYTALYMECSHKSCELTPHGDYLICPCHGSEFSKYGRVQNPPAETDLQTFKIKQDNENIYIQIA